jgi:serine/threonine protein phosphatase PrpC
VISLPASGALSCDAVETCWLTDPGCLRANNEDVCLVSLEQRLLLVSDGMGGEAAGELASSYVAEWLPLLLAEHLGPVDPADVHAVQAGIGDAIRVLNHRLRSESSALPGGAKMGATLTMVLCMPPRLYVAHLGDSRAYLLRAGRLVRLTHDHSVVGTLLERGIITLQQAAGHPMRGQLTRYVGMGGNSGADISRMRLEAGDLVVLCTDGLTDEVPEQRICEIVLEADGLCAACKALVAEANRLDGSDNITVMLARWNA